MIGLFEQVSGTFIAKVIFFIQYVLFNYRSIWYDNFGPETGLRMYDDPIAQDYPGANDGIILDTAVLTNMRVVVHDTSRDSAVRSDNDPVVQR